MSLFKRYASQTPTRTKHSVLAALAVIAMTICAWPGAFQHYRQLGDPSMESGSAIVA
jgi:hypothetical protein